MFNYIFRHSSGKCFTASSYFTPHRERVYIPAHISVYLQTNLSSTRRSSRKRLRRRPAAATRQRQQQNCSALHSSAVAVRCGFFRRVAAVVPRLQLCWAQTKLSLLAAAAHNLNLQAPPPPFSPSKVDAPGTGVVLCSCVCVCAA